MFKLTCFWKQTMLIYMSPKMDEGPFKISKDTGFYKIIWSEANPYLPGPISKICFPLLMLSYLVKYLVTKISISQTYVFHNQLKQIEILQFIINNLKICLKNKNAGSFKIEITKNGLLLWK